MYQNNHKHIPPVDNEPIVGMWHPSRTSYQSRSDVAYLTMRYHSPATPDDDIHRTNDRAPH